MVDLSSLWGTVLWVIFRSGFGKVILPFYKPTEIGERQPTDLQTDRQTSICLKRAGDREQRDSDSCVNSRRGGGL